MQVPPELCKPCLNLSSGHQEPLANCFQDMSTYVSHGHHKLNHPTQTHQLLPSFYQSTTLPGTQPPSPISSDPPSPFIPHPAASQVWAPGCHESSQSLQAPFCTSVLPRSRPSPRYSQADPSALLAEENALMTKIATALWSF